MTRRPAGPTGLDALDEITSRLGGLGDALKVAIGAVADAAAKAERSGGAEAFTIETGKGPVEVRSGFHVRVGGLGGGGAQGGDDFEVRDLNAGKVDAAEPSPGPAPRAPLVDVFDEAHAWVLTAELPGVAAEDLRVAVTDAGLDIAAAGAKPYATTVPLPPGLDPARLSHRLANGILEVRIDKGAGA